MDDNNRVDGAPLPGVGSGTGTQMLYDPLIGELVDGRYKIETRLGEGGLATVYAATHQLIEKRVALKVLKSEFVADAEIVERFLREAKAASRLNHPNIISLSDFGRVPSGAPFFVMELLDGRVLSDLLYEGRGLPVSEAVRIVTEIGHGLAAAHQHGVVHRDLKPDNIGLARDADGVEHVKILDFGLAKITQDNRKLTRIGQVLGTPEYMSPEQASGQPVDHRSDIFALGILLYRLIVGRLPFVGDTFMEVISRVLSEAPPVPRTVCNAPELTVALEAVILRALAQAPQDRFPTMDAMLDAIRNTESNTSESVAMAAVDATWLDPGPPAEDPPLLEDCATSLTEAAPPPAPEKIVVESSATQDLNHRPTSPKRSRRLLVIAGIIGVVGVSAGAVLALLLSWGPKQTSENASVTRQGAQPKVAPGSSPSPGESTVASRPRPPVTITAPKTPPVPSTVRLDIRSIPTGATVYLDSKPAGHTPLSREIPTGSQNVTVAIVRSGYRPQYRKIRPRQDISVTVLLVRSGRTKPVRLRPRPAPRPRPAKALRDLKNPFAVMKQ